MYGLETIRRINAEAAKSQLDVVAYWASCPDAVPVAEPAPAARAVRYEGHLPNGNPVQAHSAGPLYPFIAYKRGEQDCVGVGNVSVDVPSYEVAVQLAAEARKIKAQVVASGGSITLEAALTRAAVFNGRPFQPFVQAA